MRCAESEGMGRLQVWVRHLLGGRGRVDGAGLYLSPPSFDTSRIGLKYSIAAVTWDPL